MQYSIRDPLRDHAKARIWRVTYPSRPLVQPAIIAGEPIARLLELLKVQEDRTRIRAKQELSRHPRQKIIAGLEKWVADLDKDDPLYQHHLTEALWVYQWINVPNPGCLDRCCTRRSIMPGLQPPVSSVTGAIAFPMRSTCSKSRLPTCIRSCALKPCAPPVFFKDKKAVDVALEILNHETDYYLTYTLEETMRALQPSPDDVKDPRALGFVLGRMSNAELAQAPKVEAVYIAQIERKGMDPLIRESALVELAKIHKSTRETEIASALIRMDERFADTGAAEELGRLLAASSSSICLKHATLSGGWLQKIMRLRQCAGPALQLE